MATNGSVEPSKDLLVEVVNNNNKNSSVKQGAIDLLAINNTSTTTDTSMSARKVPLERSPSEPMSPSKVQSVSNGDGDHVSRTRIGSNESSTMNRITPPRTPFLIGVAGGTASGKSTVCSKIMEKLGQDTMDRYHQRVVCISQDSFYRELNEEEREEAFKGNYNFDHPDALDNDLIQEILTDVLNEKQVQIPIYDFTNMRKTENYKTVYPADVVLFEGILVFYYSEIRDMFHMKLFVDTDPDTRLARRVLRDVQERGRDLEFVLGQYTNFVKPAFEDFCLPTKKYADVIIPRGADNEVAIDLIVQMINDYLTNKQDIRSNNRPSTPGSPPPPITGRSRFNPSSVSSNCSCFGTSPPPPSSGVHRPH